MSFYFQDELCIVKGSIIQPELVKGALVHADSGLNLGYVERVSRKTLTLIVDHERLEHKNATVRIEFLGEMVLGIEEEKGQMVIVVPESLFMTEINRAKEQLNKTYQQHGQSSTMSLSHVVLFIQLFEDPFKKKYMDLFQQKKQGYLERLKKGERRFHEYKLG